MGGSRWARAGAAQKLQLQGRMLHASRQSQLCTPPALSNPYSPATWSNEMEVWSLTLESQSVRGTSM